MARKRQSMRLSNALSNRRPIETVPRSVLQVSRNEPCPCGSGQKYKACHEAQGEQFLTRIVKEQERERVQQERDRLKVAGVPWYKRIFVRG
jgi:hypothetical protein